MSFIPIREFKLGGRHGDGSHPFLSDAGAFLGDGTPLLEKDSLGRWQPRPRHSLKRVFETYYGSADSLDWRTESLAAIARALNKSDRSLAAILLVQAEFPPLPEGSEPGLAKDGRDVSGEPRIPAGQPGAGQWTVGGAIASTIAAVESAASGAEAHAILVNAGRIFLSGLGALGASATGVVTLASGLILFPTRMGGVSEGSLPDHDDIKYRYDEGALSIWHTNANGTSDLLFSGQAGSDRLYRDADGNVIGRDLGMSVALNGPAIVAELPEESGATISELRGVAPAIPDEPGCEEEWDRAEETCEDQDRKGLLGTKGYARNYHLCLLGYVSERCGGNPVARK